MIDLGVDQYANQLQPLEIARHIQRTSEDVLRMLQALNDDERITIILVTHDAEVARHARRTIRIRDGRIEDDPAASASPGPQPVTAGGGA